MLDQVIASDIKIITITGTTAYQTLDQLVRVANAAKASPADFIPKNSVIQVVLVPNGTALLCDRFTEDSVTISAGTRYVYPVLDALNKLTLKNAVTVTLEIYYGR
jgi:hypothetical protein